MAVFINIDERAAAVILLAAGIVLWGVLAPDSLQAAITTGVNVLTGAFEGAMAGVNG